MYIAERNEYVQYREAGILFWLLWVAATAVGAFAGHYLEGQILTVRLPGAFDILAAGAGGAVAGVIIGLLQGLILMPYIKMQGAIEWLIATILGRTASGIVIFLYADALAGLFLDNNYTTICGLIFLRLLLGGLLGLLISLPQYFVLRHRSRNARFWPMSNIGVSMVTTYITTLTVGTFYGLVTGAATGYAMVDVLRNPTKHAEWRVREGL